MLYELKQLDTPVLRFYANEESSEPDVKIIWINDDASLLPLDLEPTDDGLYKWLKNRTIPSNRAYVRNLLSKCGLNLNRPINIIKMSKGLSLNDCYWIVEENFDGKRGMLNFKFKKHSHYNLPDKRLRLIEQQIHERTQMLLQ